MAMSSSSPRSAPLREPPPFKMVFEETKDYYAGLPSKPRMVGRSSTAPWAGPSTGPWEVVEPKELSTVGRHQIKEVWGDLCPKVVAHLKSKKVAWTSIDVVRIGYEAASARPVIVWIGVEPDSLSSTDGTQVALACHALVLQSGITDVDVELRESRVIPFRSPDLLPPAAFNDATADVRIPLTGTLGLQISSTASPEAEGTGGFFVAEGGGSSKRIFLVTVRHVIFKPDGGNNTTYVYTPNAPRRQVSLLGNAAFAKLLESIDAEIKNQAVMIDLWKERIPSHEFEDEQRPYATRELAEAEKALKAFNTLHADVSTRWAHPDERVVGYVLYSPPIEAGVGEEEYAQDFAVIDMDLSETTANFQGNVIDLGTKLELITMMDPNYRDHRGHHNPPAFRYPRDRLLRLKGTIPAEEMREPSGLDEHGNPCLRVIKRGSGSGLTVGRANDVLSCTRNSSRDGDVHSMEWAIIGSGKRSGFSSLRFGAFSSGGDSGAVIVDGRGRIGGLLTGGAGSTDDTDITYATSIHHVMQGIRENFPDAYILGGEC